MRSFHVAAIMPIGRAALLELYSDLEPHRACAARTHVHGRTSCKESTSLHLF